MAPELKHLATGNLIKLTLGEQLWRIDWPGAPVLVITKDGADGQALYRLADQRCTPWNRVGGMALAPCPDASS